MVDAEPGRRRSAWSCSPGTRPTTRSRCSPRTATARLGHGAGPGRRRRPDLGRARARRAAGAARLGAGARQPGRRPAAHGQVRRPRSRSWRWPARPSTGCTPGWPTGCASGRTEAEVGADIAAAILEEGHAGVDFTIVGSGPNGASPHHELSDRDGAGRRPRRRRHRRGDRHRLPLGLHPHLRRRRRRRRPRSPSGTPCCRPPRRRRRPRSGRA